MGGRRPPGLSRAGSPPDPPGCLLRARRPRPADAKPGRIARAAERSLACDLDAPIGDLARDPRLVWRADARAMAAADPVRDGRAEATPRRVPRVRRIGRLGDWRGGRGDARSE